MGEGEQSDGCSLPYLLLLVDRLPVRSYGGRKSSDIISHSIISHHIIRNDGTHYKAYPPDLTQPAARPSPVRCGSAGLSVPMDST